ncbi:hypothetical protein [Streptomyces sp. NPDC092952]|uniref:hypothetical protein n=1 Tax=Streptomyces sp. NPDC092952 TaxID=3366018 RepID=UPI0038054B71
MLTAATKGQANRVQTITGPTCAWAATAVDEDCLFPAVFSAVCDGENLAVPNRTMEAHP